MTDLSQASFQDLIREMIRRLDTDPDREGLERTPERVEQSMQFLTRGYHMTAEEAIDFDGKEIARSEYWWRTSPTTAWR